MASTSNCFNGFTFSFDGKPSELYGLYMGWRSPEEEWDTGLGREIIKAETNMIRSIPNQYGTRYTDPLVLRFDIFHQDGSPFSYRESRSINNWLICDTYKKFKVNDNNTDNIYYKVICTLIQDITIGNFNGKHVEMTCDSSFGYTTDARKVIDTTQSLGKTWSVDNTSDNGIYYPLFTLQCEGNYEGAVELINHTDGGSMVIQMKDIETVNNKKVLNVDSRRMMITDVNGNLIPLYKIGWTVKPDENAAIQSSKMYWLKFVRGINKIEIKGKTKATFVVSFARKAGQINEQ